MSIQVRRAGYAAGAEVTGIDLSKRLSNDELNAVKQAWFEHQILVFPRQQLAADQLIAFSSRFGRLDPLESQPFNRLKGYQEVMLLSNRPVDGKVPPGASGGQNWHTDLSYTRQPAQGTFLYCIETPSVGGDTLFANMYTAFENLSEPLRNFLLSLEAIHDVSLINAKRAPEIIAEFKRLNPPVVHPAVRIHPDTGRPALYVNDRVRAFVGMTEGESKPIIDFLCTYSTLPKFTYRHRWSAGDLVMWDNRCLTHLAVGDFDRSEYRTMIRTSVIGEHMGRLEDPGLAAQAPAPDRDLAAAVSAMHD